MADLLSLVVDRWKSDFKGISALEIADMLGISNEDAMARLRVLEDHGTVRLRQCQLGQALKFSDLAMGDVPVRMATEFEMVDTLMAFRLARSWKMRFTEIALTTASSRTGCTWAPAKCSCTTSSAKYLIGISGTPRGTRSTTTRPADMSE